MRLSVITFCNQPEVIRKDIVQHLQSECGFVPDLRSFGADAILAGLMWGNATKQVESTHAQVLLQFWN